MRRLTLLTLLLCLTTISFVAWAQTPLTYLSIGPCRVVDTRNATGPFGGPSLVAENTRSFTFPGNPACQIPSTAMAYAVNVTVVPSAGYLGYITVWPTGQTQPGTSSLNSYDGSSKADAVVVGAGTNGAVSVYASDATDVIIDITGYFVAPNVSAVSLQYFPIQQCRIVDTTNVNGPLAGPALVADAIRTFPLNHDKTCNIPADAGALAVNLTATPPSTGDSISYMQMWPSTSAQPETSVLNDPDGTTVSNMALVDYGNGSVSVYTSDAANLAIDVFGYFAPPAPNGLAFYPIPPCRFYDSRTLNGGNPFTGQVDVNVAGSSACPGLPQVVNNEGADQAYDVNVTALPELNAGFLTAWEQFGLPPQFSQLYAWNGLPASNLTIPQTSNGWVSAFTASPANLILDLNGYFDSPVLQITSPLTGATLPAATANVPYGPVTIMAQGGIPPYSWTDTGTLPASLKIDSSSGVISGCPLAAVVSAPAITVTDTNAGTNTAKYTLKVNALDPLAITTTSPLPDGGFNVTITQTLTASGGNAPYSWSLTGGKLPPGLTLSSAGVISGVVQSGSCTEYQFTVQVGDTECGATAQAPVSMLFNWFIAGPNCF